jgi:hypothetical protein
MVNLFSKHKRLPDRHHTTTSRSGPPSSTRALICHPVSTPAKPTGLQHHAKIDGETMRQLQQSYHLNPPSQTLRQMQGCQLLQHSLSKGRLESPQIGLHPIF